MKVEVKLFAVAKDLVQSDVVCVELSNDARLADLRQAIASQFPPLAEIIPHVMFAINAEYARDEAPLSETADIACIPPVSGG